MNVLSYRHSILIFSTAFLIRACVMFFAIQPYGFYKQADSVDYHNCAVSIVTGHGMHRIDSQDPIFWRTPGYPPFLAFFYYLMGIKDYAFDKNSSAQCAAIWVQILFACCIPIILFYLAWILTQQQSLAFLIAWIATIHPGLVLASTYILTEGIALIFFYLFLLFLYKNCIGHGGSYTTIIAAAVTLSIYTWMRPMGEIVGYISTLIIFFGGTDSFKTTAKKAVLFFTIFIITLAPWYWRNYQLTKELFFCPTIGNYLNCFSVPKILRRTLGRPLLECHQIALQDAGRESYRKRIALRGTGLHVSPEISKKVSLPIVMNYPGYFIYDWVIEVIKTTFDLYTYQMIPMLNDSYWYDPLEEFLPDKIADCLYKHPMPWYLRLLCWLELIGSLLLWIGLLAGFWVFVLHSYIAKKVPIFIKNRQRMWILCIPMIGILVGMTGGFGYARLRLPAEPLLIILSLTWWFWFVTKEKK